MLPIETMREKLQSALSVKRYIHTMGVAEEAIKLAEIYGTQKDQQKAQAAGLLHDCAKDYPEEMRLRFCREYKVKLDDVMERQKRERVQQSAALFYESNCFFQNIAHCHIQIQIRQTTCLLQPLELFSVRLLRGLSNIADCFVIASGKNVNHLRAMADEVEQKLFAAGVKLHHSEGYSSGEKPWDAVPHPARGLTL